MNPTIPARVQARADADRRLQSMTLTAAVVGIAATGVFGYAAALTYSGQTNTANAAVRQNVVAPQQQPQQQFFGDDGNGGSGESGEDNGGGFVNPFFAQPVNPPTTTTRHSSHTTSGGS